MEISLTPDERYYLAGLIMAAKIKMLDARLANLSKDSQFTLSYGAAHALSLAALRFYGYRSDSRYLVFQCLQHTVGFTNAQWRVLDQCHQKRNSAEYEGHLEINDSLLKELIKLTRLLYGKVSSLEGNM